MIFLNPFQYHEGILISYHQSDTQVCEGSGDSGGITTLMVLFAFFMYVVILVFLLELQLKEQAKVPLKVVLRNFFEEHYERTTKPQYSRRKLFNEVASYLKDTYHVLLLTPSDTRYKWFLKEVIRDRSKNYKKLKIRQKIL